MLKVGWKSCPYCGDHEIYPSRTEPLTGFGRVCFLLLLQLVRCHQCEYRHYRPIFLPAPDYARPIREGKHAQATADEEKRKRSA